MEVFEKVTIGGLAGVNRRDDRADFGRESDRVGFPRVNRVGEGFEELRVRCPDV